MSQQNLSISAWLCIEEQQLGFSFWKELEMNTTNTCRTLTAHFPRPKQTSSQVSCLRVTSQAIKRRYQALLVTCWPLSPSERVKNTLPYPDLLVPGEAHHIIQLGVQFWMTLIQITCYRIQKQGGMEWLRCGAPVQGTSPMSASCTPVPITSNELNPVLLLLSAPKHQPKRISLEATSGQWWQGLIKRESTLHLKAIFSEQTNLHEIKSWG